MRPEVARPAAAPDALAPPPTVAEVVRFVAGERDAFTRVFQWLRRDVFALVRRYFRSPLDQEEAFQEAWLQIYRNRSQFDVNRHQELGPWARQVARNRCLDLLKARGRLREVPVDELDGLASEGPAMGPVQMGVQRALHAFLGRLDSEMREFFTLCFVEERPHEEIARRMDITERRSKYLKKKLLAQMLGNRSLQDAARR